MIAPGLTIHPAWAFPGSVEVSGPGPLRDGRAWTPHGFLQIAFVSPPGAPNPAKIFSIAARDYNPAEYVEMRLSGADSVRIQVAQDGMDPQGAHHSAQFELEVLCAIAAARVAGLTVIVSVQDEAQTGQAHPAKLPNDATRRVWKVIAPVFAHDRGVLFELFNEPKLKPSAANWQAWAAAVNKTLATVRMTGATNVVVADGLSYAEVLQGAPRLTDRLQQVAYAAHPYAHSHADQTVAHWKSTFGAFAKDAPVIVTE